MHEKPFLEQINNFEENYKETLNELTDSLMKRKDLDTSYVMYWRRGYPNDLLFAYVDTTGKETEYFRIDFNLSKKQLDFFNTSSSGWITYLKKYNCFELKPSYFKRQNTTLLLVIDKATLNNEKSITGLKKVFQKNNYSYYLTNAF